VQLIKLGLKIVKKSIRPEYAAVSTADKDPKKKPNRLSIAFFSDLNTAPVSIISSLEYQPVEAGKPARAKLPIIIEAYIMVSLVVPFCCVFSVRQSCLSSFA